MSEMVERVAKAIRDASYIVEDVDQEMAERFARAAIEAMRETTPGMMAAVDCDGEKAEWISGKAWKAGWQAMIDEALK